MFPIRDINPTRITPVVTVLIVAANLAIFFLVQMQGTPSDQVELLYERAAIACEITTGSPLTVEEIGSEICGSGSGAPAVPDKNVLFSVFSSMFLHGSVAHVLFNMWFLWIFGNNVEEAYGHLRYLFIYLAGGVVATGAFVAMNPDSTVPLIGASGAVAVTLGAYAVLFPAHRILSFVGWLLLPVPAALFLIIWFVGQFGLGGTGVAWEAHAGGFVFGVVVSILMRRSLLSRTVGYR